MIGQTDDMMCYSKKLIIEVVINEHPATRGGVYAFSFLYPIGLCSALRQLYSLQADSRTGQQCKAVI